MSQNHFCPIQIKFDGSIVMQKRLVFVKKLLEVFFIFSVFVKINALQKNYFVVGQQQWDKMAYLAFIICPFTTMENCPIEYEIWQSRKQFLPNTT